MEGSGNGSGGAAATRDGSPLDRALSTDSNGNLTSNVPPPVAAPSPAQVLESPSRKGGQAMAQTYKKYGNLEDTPAGKEILGRERRLKELLPTLKQKVEGLVRGQEKVFCTFGQQIVQEAHCELNDQREKAETAKAMATRCGIPPSDPAFNKARRLEADLERYMAEAARLHKLSHTYRTEIEQWRAKVEEFRKRRPELTTIIKSGRRQNQLFEAVSKDVDPTSSAFELGDWTSSPKRSRSCHSRPVSEPAYQGQGTPSASSTAKSTPGASAIAPPSSARSGRGMSSLRQQLVQKIHGGDASPSELLSSPQARDAEGRPEAGRPPPAPLSPTAMQSAPRLPIASRPATSGSDQPGSARKSLPFTPQFAQRSPQSKAKGLFGLFDERFAGATSGSSDVPSDAEPMSTRTRTSEMEWLDQRIAHWAEDDILHQESHKNDVLGDLLEDAALREAGSSPKERQYIRQVRGLQEELRKARRDSQRVRARQASHFTRRQVLEEFFLRCIDDLRRDVTRKKGLLDPSPRSSTCGVPRHRGRGDPKGTLELHSRQLGQSTQREEVLEVLLGSEVLLVHLYRMLFPHREFYSKDTDRQNHQVYQPYKKGKQMTADKVSENEPLPSLSETSYEFLVLEALRKKRWGTIGMSSFHLSCE